MFDLQMFAEEQGKQAIHGKKIVYLFRPLKNAATNAAAVIAFTTENERTKSKDADSVATKDGTIRTPGASETEITATALMAKGDTIIDDLENAMDEDELVECWEVNLEEPGTGENKFKATYWQGYVTEIGRTSSAEDFAEASVTYAANGKGAKGEATVTTDQQEMAAYVFKDTTATGA